jgi:hypothetical protein
MNENKIELLENKINIKKNLTNNNEIYQKMEG